MSLDPANLVPEVLDFLTERHLATLSLAVPPTAGEGPGLHVTPVGFSWDDQAGLARVITFADAHKVALIDKHGPLLAALSQVDGGRWLTLYGSAQVTAAPEVAADAERRYAERYRPPRDLGDQRRVIEISVDRISGRA